jgi:hypothetical protein
MMPVQALLKRYGVGEGWIDPFAGEKSPAAVTNDIEGRGNLYQMDGLAFLQGLGNESARGVLFDPPYSAEQCLRLYKAKVKGTMGRTEYWYKCKVEIARILVPGGVAISFGWDSTGIGKKRGFVIEEVLLLCHGAGHYDTIVTVDRKAQSAHRAQSK